VPPVVIAAGIAAGGSILGGAIASGSASKAAKAQQSVAQQQIAANNENRQFITGLEQPNIDRGNWAGDTYAGLLGKGDAASSQKALDTWRNSISYQDLLKTGMDAVNSNAYARGLGDSGATYKALQAKGQSLANQTQGIYMSNLNNLIQTGNSAIGNVAGVATQTTGANNAALQGSADAQSNAALMSGAGWQNAIKNLTNIGSSLATSFGGGSHTSGAPISATMPGYGAFNPMQPIGYFGGNGFGG
jgi:hypothetical protein